MIKTISLRLNQQEERSIQLLRKKGVSPSVLLRKSLMRIVQEIDEKEYKDVNSVNIFSQESKKTEEHKVYNGEIDVNKNVNMQHHFLLEKPVNMNVNTQNPTSNVFTDQYLLHLEQEIADWKQRYSIDIQYWKDAYQTLQMEYQNQMKDSMKRIDDKFDRIMFYMEEIRKSPVHPLELSSSGDQQEKPKKWTSQMIRM